MTWVGFMANNDDTRSDELLMPAEVAELFGVNVKTVTTWANRGQLACVRTLGGHRRFRADDVLGLLEEQRDDRAP